MEYSFASYPDSGESSPRSREIDFENPPPWDDQPNQNYKAKFMCSYGGKIHPRPHDNQLSYIGGETKILAVDRTIKFSSFISKLSGICAGGPDSDVSFKYQLPGEDLDALISVTNDDDLEHMMHEYDRLYRASAKPARMRLFLFQAPSQSSFGPDSETPKSDRERFVDALNSGPTEPPKAPTPNNVDFLFGLDKGVPPPPQTAVKLQDSVPEPVIPPVPEFSTRVVGSDPVMNPVEIQRQLQEFQRLQISEHEAAMYRRKSDENLVGPYAGDYYVHKVPEKAPPVTGPPNAGFWPEKQFSGGGFQTSAPEQQMYMIPAPGTVYHAAPMVRPATGPTSQGYYHNMQRVPNDVYREQPVYNMVPQQQQQQQHQQQQQQHSPPPQLPPMSASPQTVLPPQPPKMVAYTEGFGVMRPGGGGGMGAVEASGGYAPMVAAAYDGATGRQVYYTPYQGVGTAVSGDMRAAGALGQEGNKVVNKVSQASV
ncbi:hypothetical protein ACB098_07G076100 [Castanea mollissima]|uniref:PB1 domain-containing protein n=1 Tax=Castanea mollissima TaxID=60419 RepID=A0A8J4QET5_9ROSI|nr:hypothetical protein CMV_027765 [Castanea mollissima]